MWGTTGGVPCGERGRERDVSRVRDVVQHGNPQCRSSHIIAQITRTPDRLHGHYAVTRARRAPSDKRGPQQLAKRNPAQVRKATRRGFGLVVASRIITTLHIRACPWLLGLAAWPAATTCTARRARSLIPF